MTVLVTGATGLLGSHLVDLLVERGERPRALVRPGESSDQLVEAGVDVHIADLRDAGALRAAMEGMSEVLHCAARTGPWGPEAEYESTNVRGLEMVVRTALSAGARRVVHVSSITVHGNDVRGMADETAPMRTESNPYSRSKVVGERLLKRMIEQEGAPVTVVRPGWIYGPRDVASFARFATMIQAGRMIMIGSGRNHVPLIYAGDAAQGVLQAARAEAAVGRAYLLVNDEPVTQRDYLVAIATDLGVPPPTRRLPYRLALALGAGAETGARLAGRKQPPPVMRYGIELLGGENRFSIERARRELGFAPQVNHVEGVQRSVSWYRTMSSGAPAVRTG
jgi:nucleoside-diphosphate-sugar epimerase